MTTNSPTEQDGSAFRSDGLSHDEIITSLSHYHRRAVVDLLLAQDQPLTLQDVHKEIVEQEHGTEIPELDDGKIKQTMMSLHHVHVPKLAEADIVTYDRDRKIVEPTEEIEQMESFLSCVSEI